MIKTTIWNSKVFIKNKTEDYFQYNKDQNIMLEHDVGLDVN